jgi:ABC-type dipeptide/oligopeptide/nickel transport system permease component
VVRYIIRRLLWAIVLFVSVTIVTYVIFYLVPVDPARLAAGRNPTPQQVEAVAHYLGTDRPVYYQYGLFLKRLVVDHSLGYSFADREAVNTSVLSAAPVTASLVFGGAILWMLIAIPVGVFSALHPRSKTDRVAMASVLVGISAHPIWIGLVLSYVFGYVPTSGHALGLSFPSFTFLPIQGYCNLRGASQGQLCSGPIQWFYHLILPWITFAILYAAFYVRMIRANVMETLNEDYVRTARAKGLPPITVDYRHVLRNAMLPISTIIGLQVGLLLSGAVLTETVFAFPGIGSWLVDAIKARNYPVIQGGVMFVAIIVVFVNLLVDLSYGFLNPKIRLS